MDVKKNPFWDLELIPDEKLQKKIMIFSQFHMMMKIFGMTCKGQNCTYTGNMFLVKRDEFKFHHGVSGHLCGCLVKQKCKKTNTGGWSIGVAALLFVGSQSIGISAPWYTRRGLGGFMHCCLARGVQALAHNGVEIISSERIKSARIRLGSVWLGSGVCQVWDSTGSPRRLTCPHVMFGIRPAKGESCISFGLQSVL